MAETEVQLQQDRIEEILPHRGRNMLLDMVASNGETGNSALAVAAGDRLGRDYFLHESPGHGSCLHPMALLEHVAISGVVVLGTDSIALFSRVRKCAWLDVARAGEKLSSKLIRKRSPKPFYRFSTETQGEDGRTIMTSDIMAFGLDMSEIQSEPVKAGKELPGRDAEGIAARFPDRNTDFVFVDAALETNLDQLTGQFAYTYGTDHPMTEGHFPNKPLMMGITQALSICDSAQWLVGDLHADGRLPENCRVDIGGTLSRADGSPVCEVTSIKTRCILQNGTPVLLPSAAKTISFRSSVIPPDSLVADIKISVHPDE